MAEALCVGDKLQYAFSQPHGEFGETFGGMVGAGGVREIVVDQLPGPMGWYAVAVFRSDNGAADFVMPLHFAINIRKLPPLSTSATEQRAEPIAEEAQ